MPTTKQLKAGKASLKKPKTTKYANAPRVPNKLTYLQLITDPRTIREKQMVKLIKEMKNREKIYKSLLSKK